MTTNEVIVDIRLHPHNAIPPTPSRMICCIACTHKLSKYYLPMLLNNPDNPQKLPFPLGGSAPCTPSNTWFRGPTSLHPKLHVSWFSRFCIAHSVPLLYTGPLHFPPKYCPSHRDRTFETGFLRSTRRSRPKNYSTIMK